MHAGGALSARFVVAGARELHTRLPFRIMAGINRLALPLRV